MTQTERRRFLIEYLLAENSQYRGVQIPESETSQILLKIACLIPETFKNLSVLSRLQ